MAFWGQVPAYVPVAERRKAAARALAKLEKQRGRPAAPVVIEGRHIATTFWGVSWCENLENYSDFATRLPRGRSYAKNGSVVDLGIEPGQVRALVQGSALYTVEIDLAALPAERWKKVIAACAGRIGSLLGLLRGELSGEVLAVLTQPKTGLFPAPREITMRCSCPDSAVMCKHVAAVLYGVGARLDRAPELFFTLRQVDQAELIGAADVRSVLGKAGASGRTVLPAGKLGALFGIELSDVELAPATAPRPARRRPPAASARKPRRYAGR